ncbi:VWA domain-containing protein [Planctomycetota bacterium]
MRHLAVLLCMAILCAGISGTNAWAQEKKTEPRIQIAILLDTSGSMSGLINQAKTQLWKIVNEFVTAKKNGVRPLMQVALYQYGSNRLSEDVGYIRMVLPLTDDLDKVSEELFALTINGSREYCGHVIKTATEQLSWSGSNEDLKAIYIAGNEPFTQGSVDYQTSCKGTIKKGITVNTIFCGPYQTGISGKWQHGAELADGSYMNIDQNRKNIYIEAPQDKEITRLNAELNKTYIAYGRKGNAAMSRQSKQDSNAAKSSAGSYVQRAVTKSSSLYRNTGWDLVDAHKEGKKDVTKMKEEELPENMRKMTPEERKAYIEKMAEKRKEIQAKIQKLNGKRKKYVAEKMKELSVKGKDTLDAVMIKSLRKQAAEKKFNLK